jgi:tetratricopeptide (TPR) repeat protein
MRNTTFALAALALCAAAPNDDLRAERYATASADALRRSDYPLALSAAQDGLKIAPNDGWLLYDQGAALAGLGHTDEAVRSLADAERAFHDNPYGRSTAVYRAALAYEMAGRCIEAKREFQRYAVIERGQNAMLADDAVRHASMCLPGAERQNVSGKIPAR